MTWDNIELLVAANSTAITVFSLAIGVAGIILAVVFYRLGKPVRRLAFATRTFPVVLQQAKRIKGLNVDYKAQNVSRLSVSRLAIWNAGTEPIRGSEISEHDPLRLSAGDGVKVLGVELVEATRAANRLTVLAAEETGSGWKVMFDFLDPRDGALMDVVHDGTGLKDIALVGTIVGVPIRRTIAAPETTQAEKSASRVQVESARRNTRGLARMMVVVGTSLALLAFFIHQPKVAGAAGLLVVFGVGINALARRIYPPQSIRMFDSDL